MRKIKEQTTFLLAGKTEEWDTNVLKVSIYYSSFNFMDSPKIDFTFFLLLVKYYVIKYTEQSVTLHSLLVSPFEFYTYTKERYFGVLN